MNASSGASSSVSSDSSAAPAASSTAVLPPSRQRRLANDLAKIVAFVGTPPPGGPQAEMIEHVDFPRFVAGLIEGLLKAMVHGEDASDHHMRAYAQLVEAVSRSVEEFQESQLGQQNEGGGQTGESERPHRDFLANKYPEFVGKKAITPATKRALVADILLMGIDRVVAGAPRPAAAPKAKAKAKVKVKAKVKAKTAAKGKVKARKATVAPKRKAAPPATKRKAATAKARSRR